MTDPLLTEAINAVKFAKGQTGNVHFVATILQAVASGQLVTKADADLAVAEALRKAGEAVPQGWCEPETSSTEMDVTLGAAIQRVIKRLANQDHLAEVQALRAEREALLALRSAIAVKGGSEHYPTEEAYLLACAAIEKHRASAAAALAEVARLREALQEIADMDGLQDWQPEAAACVNRARSALTPKGDTP